MSALPDDTHSRLHFARPESPTPSRQAYAELGPSDSSEQRHKPSDREKRTYRACLHCRQRKSRCDLYSSGEPGRPPCERCIREQHECELGGSRRGGKRIKKTHSSSSLPPFQYSPPAVEDGQSSLGMSQHSMYLSPGPTEDRTLPWPAFGRDTKGQPPSEPAANNGGTPPSGDKMTVDDTIASADLQNPSDALEFLAHVADRAEGRQLPPISGHFRSDRPSVATTSGSMEAPSGDIAGHIQFPPLQRGQLNIEVMFELLRRFEERYHPFFPLANPTSLDPQKLRQTAAREPYLLTAICTVASKDDKDWWQIHEACSAHMQQLIAALVYSGRGTVEAVEALLILAEWVPRRPNATPAIGRGEEDQAAWMFVGSAIRLGYLLGLDRTAFRSDTDVNTKEFNRKRLAWAACYMSDRQVSVRIGKAFWSRGPGPMTGLNAQDFPSLQSRDRNDDYAAIFQANLELTQLFSNAHDVLYASKNRANQLNFGGEYVKYIDDFRVAIRNWHSSWGMLSCSPPLKASLILSYEYLRLYVNAFAYQATLNRMVTQTAQTAAKGRQDRREGTARYPFTDFVAATPDARFIYDSIDAAKSLLSTFNSFVDPVATFRYMPLRYYLYVIYSACFLYKARSTGVLGGDRGSVKRMIADAVDRLQKASACSNDVGDRYSRLIRLLWRKPPAAPVAAAASAEIPRPATATQPYQSAHGMQSTPAVSQQQQQQQQLSQFAYDAMNPYSASINAFSWLDLSAVGDFATNNNSTDGLDQLDESSTDGFSNFDPNSNFDSGMVNTNVYGWNGVTPPDIVF